MKKYNRLAVALLDLRTDPPSSLIIVFLCGVMILTILSNYIYSFIAPVETSPISYIEHIIIALVFLLAIACLSYRCYEQTLHERTTIIEKSQFLPVKYVISGLSPLSIHDKGGDNLENIRRLLLYNKDIIQTLYLVSILDQENGSIVTYNTDYTEDTSKKVKDAYNMLQDWINQNLELIPQIVLVPIRDSNSAEFTFKEVSELLISFLAKGIPTTDILVDITAGTKPMTVGLATAALSNGFPVSYQASKRDDNGNPLVNDKSETMLVALNLHNHLRLPD